MCIEVFHPEMPLIIRYANETLRFENPRELTVYYVFLVQNAGNADIRFLNVLFPRRLYWNRDGDWYLEGVQDITPQIRDRLRNCDGTCGDKLRLLLPDPNRPQFNLPPLEGEWCVGNSSPELPPGMISEGGLSLMANLECAFFQVDLSTVPLVPGASRWFGCQVELDGVGIECPSPFGANVHLVIHQVASPCAVRRTLEEKIETVQRTFEAAGPAFVADLCKDLRQVIGITTERRVNTEFQELVVQPGPPGKRSLIGWDVERDLRMRSGSPRWGNDPLREPIDELLYEWKTGSLLTQGRNPWRNDGFTLHLTFVEGG